MNRENNSKVFNRLPDGADVHEESKDVSVDTLMESTNKILNRFLLSSSRPSRRLRLMTSLSLSSSEGSTQLEENKTDRDEQYLLASDLCSFSQMLESVRDVDEIIKYARHNLEEAGKTLASLNENNLKHRKLRRRKKRNYH